MEKIYQKQNVYEAFIERLDYIFAEFENIYISFSGGKDSGLLYHLVLKYMSDNNITNKIGLFHQDFEAQYSATTNYVDSTFAKAPDFIDKYWCCLPMSVRNAMSNYNPWWYPWDDDSKNIWVRPMPTYDYVINVHNNPFDFYKDKILPDTFYKQFGRWYKNKCGGGKTIGLIGIRSDESLNRYSAIINKKYDYKGVKWITKGLKDVYSAAPLYDWCTEDVWTANGKFNFDYNKLYDLYYKAGVPFSSMRVASPFVEWAGSSLNLYRIIEPETWTKVVGRVNGANFGAIYGATKAMGYKSVTLPKGHTWQSYTEFLLSTLPEKTKNNYIEKFNTSKEFWNKTGGGFSEDVIKDIESNGYQITRNGVSNYSKDGKIRIIFNQDIPDDTDDVTSTLDIPSWKRMCYCILKNDYLCRFMGFGETKPQKEHIKEIKSKYTKIIRGGISDV